VLGKSIIGAIYQGGEFELYDTQQTAAALSYFAIGLLGYAGIKVLTPAFYALNDARTPMLVSMASVVINYLAAAYMVHRAGAGHAGLALATSLVALFNFLILFLILRSKLGGIYGRALVASVWKVVVAAMAMGIVVAGLNALVSNWLGVTRTAYLADLALTIPVGLLVFYYVAKLLDIPELAPAFRALGNPVMRRLRRRGVTIQ
jgi:putative peptidoglycan lipid II flippase